MLGEWRAWGEERRDRSYFSKQGVKKTNLKERKYRATTEKNEETDETEKRLV